MINCLPKGLEFIYIISVVAWGTVIIYITLIIGFYLTSQLETRFKLQKYDTEKPHKKNVRYDTSTTAIENKKPFFCHQFQFCRKGKRVTLFEDTLTIKAETKAIIRSKIIDGFFERRQRASNEHRELEFIEIPPTIKDSDREKLSIKYLTNRKDIASQIARLKWQKGKYELLLLERVVDAALCYYRLEIFKSDSNKYMRFPSIKLIPIKRKSNEYIPWRVVVETNDIEFYVHAFKDLVDWFGIGVEFASEKSTKYYGKCKHGNSSNGIVGGVLYCYDNLNNVIEKYAMTCAHVLSDTCLSIKVGRGLSDTDGQPDVALISTTTPCFPINIASHKRVLVATNTIILDCMKNEHQVTKIYPASKNIKGYIHARISAVVVEGQLYRFPHLEITRKFSRARLTFLPSLFNQGFNTKGDSGSWVVEEKSEAWVGMVVAGQEFFPISYLIEAEPLMDYLREILAPNTYVTPLSYT